MHGGKSFGMKMKETENQVDGEDFNDNEYIGTDDHAELREQHNVMVGCLDELISGSLATAASADVHATTAAAASSWPSAPRATTAGSGSGGRPTRQADFIMVAGTITAKMAPVLSVLRPDGRSQICDRRGRCAIAAVPFKRSYTMWSWREQSCRRRLHPGACARGRCSGLMRSSAKVKVQASAA